ncbi:hypothetical protein KP509_1Z196900 [Ceratopteris richardii]|nr:hypothetical protein KP509_1Z272600 [Ceratopteris richardii]KAH6556216.1 hypothetical protein KP509_1Z196700 [Ceratopteris richardii]KAH6556218.1 hypothetical protein KP509_1Z196900 [Ceratopteris richardii]
MGRFLRKLAPSSSKRMTRQLSFSHDRKLDSSQSSQGVLRRLISSCQLPSRSRRTKCMALKGHLPIRIVDACTSDRLLYFIKVAQLNDPLITQLLQQAAEEYGYSRPGIVEVSCHGETREKILRILNSS